MTTPFLAPIFQVQAGTSSDQFWGAAPGAPDLLLVNTSGTDTITIGPRGVAPYAPNGQVILPLQSISVPASQDWSAVTDATDAPVLQVTPGGGNYTPSAAAIAAQIAASGLALSIAEQIAAAGVSLLAAPVLLYDVAPQQVTGAALVGATQGITSYPAGTTMGQAITQWDAIPAVPATSCAKVFYTAGDIPAAFTADASHDLPYFAANGIKCLLCMKPDINGDQAVALQQFLALCQQAGLIAKVILWQEANDPNNDITAAQFAGMWNTYAPIVRNPATVTLPGGGTYAYTGYKCCMDFAVNTTAGAPSIIGSYFTSAISKTVDELSADFYGKDWDQFNPNGYDLAYIASLADSPPNGQAAIPFGVTEFNANLTGALAETPAQVAAFFAYITGFMGSGGPSSQFPAGGRLYQGKQNADSLIFNGGGPLASPLITDDTDVRVNGGITPDFQDVFTALNAATPYVPFTVAPGATVTLVPVTPSPGAGYAAADGISYDIAFTLASAAAGSTNPFVSVELQWYAADSLAAAAITPGIWSVPIGANGTSGTLITGTGPQRGQYLAIRVRNLDTVAVNVTCQVNSNSRPAVLDDWEWGNSVAVPGYILPGGAAYGGSLGSIAANGVVAGGSAARLLNLKAGPAWVRFGQTGGTDADCELALAPQPASLWGTATILNTTADKLAGGVLMSFPRAPVLATITNNSTGAMDLFAEFIAAG